MLLTQKLLNSRLNMSKFYYFYGLSVQRSASSNAQSEAMKDYWSKNKRLNRPISPFVIYKPQITTVLSITHRSTGIALSFALYAFGISQLIINNNWSNQLVQLQAICPNVFLVAKSLIVASFYYHLLNGVRHLCWDLGKGFHLKTLYASGYAVVFFSLLITAVTLYNF